MKKENIIQSIKVIALGLMVAVGLSYAFAWTAPSLPPPEGNVPAPVNVGVGNQTKEGNMSFLSSIDAVDAYFGKVGIGTMTPGAKLDVAGDIRASGTVCDGTGCIGGGASTAPDFETIIAVASAQSYTIPHGLGVTPKSVEVYYCRTADCSGTNFIVDRNRYSPGGDYGAQIGFDGINIKIRVGTTGVYLNPEWVDGGAATSASGYYRVLAW